MLCIDGPFPGVEFRERLLRESVGGCGRVMARAFGDGGIERPSRGGARGLLPRPPGTGGLSIGGGGVDIEVYKGVD